MNVGRPVLDLCPTSDGVRVDIRVADGLLIVQQYYDGRPAELTWNPTFGLQVFVELPRCQPAGGSPEGHGKK